MVGRHFFTRVLAFASMLALSVLARIPEARAATPPALGGTFMFLGTNEPSIPEDKLLAYFAELSRAGMDTVIIQSTRTRKPSGCGNPYAWVPNMPDRIGVILDAAQARGFKVWVGLSMSDGCWDGAATTKAEARADTDFAMRSLYPRIGNHPAFAGIYLSDEPYLADNSQFAYFKTLADAVRAVANVPIAVSPYLYALTTSPPAALAHARAPFAMRRASICKSGKTAWAPTPPTWAGDARPRSPTTTPRWPARWARGYGPTWSSSRRLCRTCSNRVLIAPPASRGSRSKCAPQRPRPSA